MTENENENENQDQSNIQHHHHHQQQQQQQQQQHNKQNKQNKKSKQSKIQVRSKNKTDEGKWQRRRQLDGALNRVPYSFYIDVWHLLSKCHGIYIGNQMLPHHPTVQEMTAGETKVTIYIYIYLQHTIL